LKVLLHGQLTLLLCAYGEAAHHGRSVWQSKIALDDQEAKERRRKGASLSPSRECLQ
jgi:hypothetical protein